MSIQALSERLSSFDRRILGKIFVLPYEDKASSRAELALLLDNNESELSERIKKLAGEGFVDLESSSGHPTLTDRGRQSITVVFTGGSFDIIHPGHIETLEQSKALGDVLIVSVSRDSTFEKNKKRKPFFNEQIRRKTISAIRCVDAAVLGSESDIFEIVEKIRPDVITLGYDQHHQESIILEESKRRGVKVRVVRLGSSIPDAKTSKLLTDNPGLIKDS